MEHSSPDGRTAGKFSSAAACLLFVVATSLAVFYSSAGAFKPSAPERERKRQELLADRTRLMLELSKCRGYGESVKDPYNCPTVSVAYKTMAGGDECRMVEDAAREAGVAARSFAIPLKGGAASLPATGGPQMYMRGTSF
ncbi:MAG: hypothetical protein LBV01_05550 [Deltaproteobacteria bacterium]|jgi:hypothetical protein|nr:hypothetical protein [Deltaproteobacteria bacterium]